MLCNIDLIPPHTFTLSQLQAVLQDAPNEWQAQLVPFFDEHDIKIKNLDPIMQGTLPENNLVLHLNPGIGEPAIFNGLWAENAQSETLAKLIFFLLQKLDYSYCRLENRHHDYPFRTATQAAQTATLQMAIEKGLLTPDTTKQNLVFIAQTEKDLFRPIDNQLHAKDVELSPTKVVMA